MPLLEGVPLALADCVSEGVAEMSVASCESDAVALPEGVSDIDVVLLSEGVCDCVCEREPV